jgi:hypothetical protein
MTIAKELKETLRYKALKKVRHTWQRKPVEQIVPNKKRKNRQQLKRELRKDLED